MNSGNHSEERFFEVVRQLDTSERRPNSSKLLAARIVNSAITVVMSTLQFRKRHLLALFTTILAAHACYAAEGEFTVETGGVQIALGTGWETLQQPANYFVQKRGRNAERGIALSAGSFKLDLPVELYTAIGIGSLMSSPESQLDYLAKQVGV